MKQRGMERERVGARVKERGMERERGYELERKVRGMEREREGRS